MSRIVKVAAAAIGTAAAVIAAFFLHPRAGAARRATVRRESANVAALVGSAIDTPRRTLRRAGGEQLAARAQSALQEAFGEDAGEITVRAAGGVVTLRGEVDDIDDIARFDAAVRTVPGVADVDNLLRLRLAGLGRPRVLTA